MKTENKLWVYQPGKLHAQTTTTEDAHGNLWADFTACDNGGKNKNAHAYLVELNASRKPGEPEFALYPTEEFLRLKNKAVESSYITPWAEISEEQWDYALNVLPPQKWQTVNGVNIFRMCEYSMDNITAHYARIGERYFTAERRTSTPYTEIAKQVSTVYASKPQPAQTA